MRGNAPEDADPSLPPLVVRYLERAGIPESAQPASVRVTQEGQMWRSPGARPLRFTASEELAVAQVAFSWHARFPIVSLVSLHVRDAYADGEGELLVRLLGIVPIVHRRGAALSVGEAMRYLAELPWVPHAMRLNRELEWRELSPRTVEVSTRVGSRRAAVQLVADESGDIIEAFSPERPRPESGDQPLPWRGRFADYAYVGGVRVPTRAAVSWEVPEGAFTYWSGTITSLEVGEESA
jgi:hypothetical protein